MRRISAVMFGLVCGLVTLPASQASAACVDYTPGPVIAEVYWPVNAYILGPGTVSTTPTDCIP